MLTGPLYMLQIYDRVLTSRSQETLVALTLLMTFLFLVMGVLDYVRGRVLAIAGAQFQDRLDRRVFEASLARISVAPRDLSAITAQRDLEAVQRLIGSPVLVALFDVPWTPFFVGAMFLFHPMLGWLAMVGGALLIAITSANQLTTTSANSDAGAATIVADGLADQLRQECETVRALGMTSSVFDRLQKARRRSLFLTLSVTGRGVVFAVIAKTLRLFIQSAVLGVGAWLVLQGEISAGVMMAASILMGRALAPIEQAMVQWSLVQRAREGWKRLGTLLDTVQPEPTRTDLPVPAAKLDVTNLSVAAPGEPGLLLKNVSFSLQPGQAMGVIGPSGSGKSTLARAIVGIWPATVGTIRLGGATLDQFAPDVLGRHVGYLPQHVTLFDGTIAENIARMQNCPDGVAVVEAAKKAAAHDLILNLPDGYDTMVSSAGGRLSGGQIQRIGLARALYGNPIILVLDEPNSNLDNEGSMALNVAVRAMKAENKVVMIVAHRPAAIQECDLLLLIEGGVGRAFGPRDQILREVVKNHTEILKPALPRTAI
jgi:ATP-binding cassette subfamily C protein